MGPGRQLTAGSILREVGSGTRMRQLGGGVAAGVVATLPMSAVMLGARQLGLLTRQPPERIATGALARAGATPPRGPARDALGSVAHLGFGGAAGALFGLLAPRLGRGVPRPVAGAAYATVVWAGSYLGWAPALGLMPPAWRDERARQPVMIVAHWVYGAVLGLLLGGSRGPAR